MRHTSTNRNLYPIGRVNENDEIFETMATLNIPPELKKITQYIRRAEELDKDKTRAESRLVAYYCRQYAVEVGLPFSNTPAAKQCLGKLLGDLEKEKVPMSNFSRVEAEFVCRNFARTVFDRADEEDRMGSANKGTAKTFYAAATFLEMLQQFYQSRNEEEYTEEQEEDKKRRVYSKWKATDILKSIREGRNVIPGGYGELEAAHDQIQSAQVQDDAIPEAPSSSPRRPGANMPPAMAPQSYNAPEPDGDVEPANIAPGVAGDRDDGQGEEMSIIDHPPPSSPPRSQNSSDRPPLPSIDAGRPSSPSSLSRNSRMSPPPPVSYPSMSSVASSVASALTGGGGSIATPRVAGKVTKADIADAVELTRFALSALEGKDTELGAQRLEEALGCLGKSSSSSGKVKHSKDAIDHAQKAVKYLKKNDAVEGERRLHKALGALRSSSSLW